eukprot:tig00021348_g20539.t1
MAHVDGDVDPDSDGPKATAGATAGSGSQHAGAIETAVYVFVDRAGPSGTGRAEPTSPTSSMMDMSTIPPMEDLEPQDPTRAPKDALRVPEDGKRRKLNVGVVGKTTAIFSLLHQYGLQKNDLEDIARRFDLREPTRERREIPVPPLPGSNLDMTFIDFPGYTSLNGMSWLQGVEDYVNGCYVRYSEMQKMRLYSEVRDPDPRVHVVIYFIAPHSRLAEFDVQVLRRLGELTNLVVVIAKSDAMTTNEATQFSTQVRESLGENNIETFTCNINRGVRGAFGPVQPYSIVTSTEASEEGRLYRRYNWGSCFVDDPAHSDLGLVRDLLFSESYHDIIEASDLKTQRHNQRLLREMETAAQVEREQQEREQQQQRRRQRKRRETALWSASGIALVIAICFFSIHSQKLELQKQLQASELQKIDFQQLERQKLEEEKLKWQTLEQQKLEQQKSELRELQQQLEQLEQQRIEQQKLEQQKLEKQKLEWQKLEQQKLEKQQTEFQKLQKQLEQLEQQQIEQKKRDQQKLEKQKIELQKLEQQNQKLEKQHADYLKLQKQLEQLEAEQKKKSSWF